MCCNYWNFIRMNIFTASLLYLTFLIFIFSQCLVAGNITTDTMYWVKMGMFCLVPKKNLNAGNELFVPMEEPSTCLWSTHRYALHVVLWIVTPFKYNLYFDWTQLYLHKFFSVWGNSDTIWTPIEIMLLLLRLLLSYTHAGIHQIGNDDLNIIFRSNRFF